MRHDGPHPLPPGGGVVLDLATGAAHSRRVRFAVQVRVTLRAVGVVRVLHTPYAIASSAGLRIASAVTGLLDLVRR